MRSNIPRPTATNFLFEHNMGNVVAMIKWVVRCKDKDITQQPPLFRALVRSRRPACTCSTSSPGPRQCSCPPRTRGEQRVNIFGNSKYFLLLGQAALRDGGAVGVGLHGAGVLAGEAGQGDTHPVHHHQQRRGHHQPGQHWETRI